MSVVEKPSVPEVVKDKGAEHDEEEEVVRGAGAEVVAVGGVGQALCHVAVCAPL